MEVYANDILEERRESASLIAQSQPAYRKADCEGAQLEMPAKWAYWATALSFILPDTISLTIVWAVSGLAFSHVTAISAPEAVMGPLGLLLGSGFLIVGLYGRVLTMHPTQELRVVGLVTTLVYWVYGAACWLAGLGGAMLLLALAGMWVVSVLLITTTRALSRIFFARTRWWGMPVLVVASSQTAGTVVKNLKRWPEIGLKPVLVLQDEGEAEEIEGVPVRQGLGQAPGLIASHRFSRVILSMPALEKQELTRLIRRYSRLCDEVLVMSDVLRTAAFWTSNRSFKDFMGYGVQHVSKKGGKQKLKRALDLAGAFLALVLCAPLLLAIAVLIKLDSPGPVFFRQLRMGREGRCFGVLKFRSMYVDADKRLQKILRRDDALRAEYKRYHKLKIDPRVTKIGEVLRRFSLDELPQLWNVVKGDMSLVGPRAYMPRELPDMGGVERVILQSRPGISGLWQVSGRNALSFVERTQMDVHYVHNWTPWLDLYILARTIPIIFEGESAA